MKYSVASIKTMRSLLDTALEMLNSGMAAAAGKTAEIERQVATLSEKLFEAACERGCTSIDFNYYLVSDDGNYQDIMHFDSDSDAIQYVQQHFELFGSLRMIADTAQIFRRENGQYYLAATVDMASLKLVQLYPVGYWIGSDDQPEDDQDDQTEAEQDENQSDELDEHQSEEPFDCGSPMFLHVETVYQLAAMDFAFGSGLRQIARTLHLDAYCSDDPFDYLAHAMGFAEGALMSLCFHSGSGICLAYQDYIRIQADLVRLHDLILSRIDVDEYRLALVPKERS